MSEINATVFELEDERNLFQVRLNMKNGWTTRSPKFTTKKTACNEAERFASRRGLELKWNRRPDDG